MAKKYFWLKMDKDYLFSPKIKKLRKIAGGDTYTIIYLKIQLLSIDNGGIIEFQGIEPSLKEELALMLDEDVDNVGITLNYMFSQNLIKEIEKESYLLPDASERIGSESDSKQRVQKYRERKKLEQAKQLAEANKSVTCNGYVTKCNTDIEIDIDKEKEIDIEKETETELELESPDPSGQGTTAHLSVPYQEIMRLYNETCLSYPRCRTMSEARKKAIRARFNAGYTLEDFQELFEKTEKSSFLRGGNNNNWSANFDWLIKDANMAKVLDGNYDDKKNDVNYYDVEDDIEYPF